MTKVIFCGHLPSVIGHLRDQPKFDFFQMLYFTFRRKSMLDGYTSIGKLRGLLIVKFNTSIAMMLLNPCQLRGFPAHEIYSF